MDFSVYKPHRFELRNGDMVSPISRRHHAVQWCHLIAKEEGAVVVRSKHIGRMKKVTGGFICLCDLSSRSVGDVLQFGSRRYKVKKGGSTEILYGVVLDLRSDEVILGLTYDSEIAFEDAESLVSTDSVDARVDKSLEISDLVRRFAREARVQGGEEVEQSLLKYFVLGCRLHKKGVKSSGRNACASALKGAAFDKMDRAGYESVLGLLDGHEVQFIHESNKRLNEMDHRRSNDSEYSFGIKKGS